MNQAGRMGVNQTSLRCWEEGVLSAISSWVWVAASAASVGSSAAPVSAPSVEPATVAAASAAAFQSSAYSWDMYKTRLAALARQQGVRESTIRTYVPGLLINNQAIELERTEPVARSSGAESADPARCGGDRPHGTAPPSPARRRGSPRPRPRRARHSGRR